MDPLKVIGWDELKNRAVWKPAHTWLGLASLMGLPCVMRWCRHHEHFALGFILGAWWVVAATAVLARLAWVRIKRMKENRERLQKRQNEGIRRRLEIDEVVSHVEWYEGWAHPTESTKWIDWVEGEARELRPTDVLLKWKIETTPGDWDGGYAVERNGKIIAQIRTYNRHIKEPVGNPNN